MSKERGRRKILEGVVVSDKMDKTRVVVVDRKYPHPKYKKVVVSKKKFKAHDEENATRVGDKVRIMETRPLSKEKRWIIMEIIEKAKGRGE